MRGRILLLLLDQLGCQPPQEVSGGLSIAFQGEAGWHAPGARPGSVPWGSSPPAEAAHRPDPAARVPGRIDVRGWKEQEKRVEACALVNAALVAGTGVCSAHRCLSSGLRRDHLPAKEDHPSAISDAGAALGNRISDSHQDTLPFLSCPHSPVLMGHVHSAPGHPPGEQ